MTEIATDRAEPTRRFTRPTCIVPLGAVTGMLVGVLTALSAWWFADLDADETLIGTALGAIMGTGLGTAAGLVASVLFDPSDLIKLCHLCRRPITGRRSDCPGCGCPDHPPSPSNAGD